METDENTLVPDDIPTLEPIPMDQNNHETIFINETKLTELKQDLQKHKIEVSYNIKHFIMFRKKVKTSFYFE